MFYPTLIVVLLVGLNELYKELMVELTTTNTQKTQTKQYQDSSVDKFKVGDKEYKRTFIKSKQILEHNIYINHRYSFYANCPLSYTKNHKDQLDLQPDLSVCNEFAHRKNKKAFTLDWEHVMPASLYGQTLDCWTTAKTLAKNSRTYCAKMNPQYRAYESDLINLVPSIAEINRDRKNYKFSEIKDDENLYGDIDFEIDFKNKSVEPANYVKGDIARIAFYMKDRYGININNNDYEMFKRWDKLDPVSEWEREKNKYVLEIQGENNHYVR